MAEALFITVILTKIFEFSLIHEACNPRRVLRLQLVCQAWRAVAQGMSCLWTRLPLDASDQSARAFLDRHGVHPLMLFIQSFNMFTPSDIQKDLLAASGDFVIILPPGPFQHIFEGPVRRQLESPLSQATFLIINFPTQLARGETLRSQMMFSLENMWNLALEASFLSNNITSIVLDFAMYRTSIPSFNFNGLSDVIDGIHCLTDLAILRLHIEEYYLRPDERMAIQFPQRKLSKLSFAKCGSTGYSVAFIIRLLFSEPKWSVGWTLVIEADEIAITEPTQLSPYVLTDWEW
ncbi:hypothetical protein SISSUDRAFT_1068187 [Sistotremastrum suecicum HHB10207 ss-3]|uniref:F-box domain-containing protein n=1 Tax=Sistotremastrum suecicum HHB10207 ss-3 TaxID=1314776 RepID=A0A165WE20_9AGAM|nr:hypothetical protein SISSUDRAFT_1068187 [Sistotremastrum suecicum HHB10207 ss-3]